MSEDINAWFASLMLSSRMGGPPHDKLNLIFIAHFAGISKQQSTTELARLLAPNYSWRCAQSHPAPQEVAPNCKGEPITNLPSDHGEADKRVNRAIPE